MFLPESFEFTCPAKTNSGNKALEHIPVELDALGARKPLLIANKKMVGYGFVDKLIGALGDSGMTIGVFDGVTKNPDLMLVKDLAALCTSRGYDSIIAMGGRAVTDTAKVVNAVVSLAPDNIESLAGDGVIARPLKPFAVIQTLSGSDMETSKYAAIGNLTFSSQHLMPQIVFIDSRTSASRGPLTTSSTALSALTHAVEAFVAPVKNPLSETYAYAAIQFVAENLVPTFAKHCAKKQRLALTNAAAMAGYVVSNTDKGMTHELGIAVAGSCGLQAGICMGIILPYALEYLDTQDGYNVGQLLLPIGGQDLYVQAQEKWRANSAIALTHKLMGELSAATGGKIPRTFKDTGVAKEAVKASAQLVSNKFGFDADACLSIVERAWEGKAF
ncbi:MAG: iron-containing alcohol dehydrogenase [Smithellaceae bacterium]|nr:iron-containing alcohol dehydrogenase [Smithellaceae bacterium]